MKFPDTPRVRYSRNPLAEVVCQLRFPKILRIETEVPVEFQEAVRADYPLLNISRSLELPLLTSPQSNSPPMILGQALSYEFLDKKGDWKLGLSSDFIALSTLKYNDWQDFKNRLSTVVDLFVKYYNPSHFIRIGLRYQDVIMRSELGLENCPWRELLKPSVLGIFATNDFPEEDFTEALSLFVCRLDYTNAMMGVRYGLAQKNGSKELGYLIDADFYTEKLTERKDAIEHLNQFNREAGNFFRWCITDQLRQALEPKPIEA